jgi:hypothetical protein
MDIQIKITFKLSYIFANALLLYKLKMLLQKQTPKEKIKTTDKMLNLMINF